MFRFILLFATYVIVLSRFDFHPSKLVRKTVGDNVNGSSYSSNNITSSRESSSNDVDPMDLNYEGLEISDDVTEDIVKSILGRKVINLYISHASMHYEDLFRVFHTICSSHTAMKCFSIRHSNLNQAIKLEQLNTKIYSSNLEVLDISFNNLKSRSIRIISAIISKLSELETIVLDGNSMTSVEMRFLVQAIRKHPSLKKMYFSKCQLQDDVTNILSLCMKSNRNLTHIDISQNAISADGMEVLAMAFKAGAAKKLEYLDLSYNPIGELGLLSLIKSIESNQLPALKHLILKEIGCSASTVKLLCEALALHNIALLETLDLSGNELLPKPKESSKPSKSKFKKVKQQFSEVMMASLKGLVSQFDSLSSNYFQQGNIEEIEMVASGPSSYPRLPYSSPPGSQTRPDRCGSSDGGSTSRKRKRERKGGVPDAATRRSRPVKPKGIPGETKSQETEDTDSGEEQQEEELELEQRSHNERSRSSSSRSNHNNINNNNKKKHPQNEKPAIRGQSSSRTSPRSKSSGRSSSSPASLGNPRPSLPPDSLSLIRSLAAVLSHSPRLHLLSLCATGLTAPACQAMHAHMKKINLKISSKTEAPENQHHTSADLTNTTTALSPAAEVVASVPRVLLHLNPALTSTDVIRFQRALTGEMMTQS